MSNELPINVIAEIIQSKAPYPVSLEQAWVWIGYAEKRNALNALKSNFIEGLDFSYNRTQNPDRGRPSDQYLLTIDCFKCLAMMASTEKGKEVRQYFLRCERSMIERRERSLPPSTPIDRSLEHLAYLFSETDALLKTLLDALAFQGNMTAGLVIRAAFFNLAEIERRTCVIVPDLAPFSYPEELAD